MQTQLLDFYRNGFRTATEIMKASLENTKRLQQKQLQIVQSVMEESEKSATQFGDVKGIDELLSLQSRLAQAQVEAATEFWTSMWRAAAEQQKSAIDQMQSQMGQAKDRMRETFAFTERTSDEAARVVATQAAKVAGSFREATAQQEQERKAQEQQRKSA